MPVDQRTRHVMEIKNLPVVSSSDPQWAPSPINFMLCRLVVIISCFILNDYAVDLKMALDHDLMLRSNVPFFSRFRDVMRGECWAKFTVGVSTWLSSYCGI